MESESDPAAPDATRESLAPLFSAHTELRAVIDAVLENQLGTVAADDLEAPKVARLSIGCYEIFGGTPNVLAAGQLVETSAAPRELIYGNNPEWRTLLRKVHGKRLSDRPMRSFDASHISADRLPALAGSLPAEFEPRRMDLSLSQQLDAQLEPHALQVYPSPEAFLKDGFGLAVVVGNELASAATSYGNAPGDIEVAIATRPSYRGRGFASGLAAGFVLHCIQNGVRPHWNASNPVSQRLAVRLGFRPAGVCEVLYLH